MREVREAIERKRKESRKQERPSLARERREYLELVRFSMRKWLREKVVAKWR